MKRKIIFGVLTIISLLLIFNICIANNEVEQIQNNEEVLIVDDKDFRVNELIYNRILIGDENGNLKLDSILKREEMVVLISRLMGKEEEAKIWDTSKLTFQDVEKNNWAAGYIAWAKDNNITKGYSEEWFGYNDTLTEKQTAIFLLRVLGYNEANLDNARILASDIGLIGYYDELEDIAISRRKVAIMIYNTLHANIKDSDEILIDKLQLNTILDGIERDVALVMNDYGIRYIEMTESNDWKILFVDLSEKDINSKTVEDELFLYYGIGNYLDFSHYVLVDIMTEDKVEVMNYVEHGVIYHIKYNDEIIYQYEQ